MAGLTEGLQVGPRVAHRAERAEPVAVMGLGRWPAASLTRRVSLEEAPSYLAPALAIAALVA
jgi:hypothetical protein